MKTVQPKQALRAQGGALLVEGMAAILIFSLGILAIIGLQAASIKNTTESKYRVDASLVANQALGQMWADRPNLATYVSEVDVADLPNGRRKIEVNGTTVTVTVTWRMPSDVTTRKYQTVTQING
jgi:type IV pilus assembly protein PilV